MDQKEALASLETIRRILERSTSYTHIAPSGIIAGGLAAAGAAAAGDAWVLDPMAPAPLPFLALWALAFLAAVLAGAGASAHRARRRGERFWSRKLQFVVVGFIPPVAGAAALTAALYDVGRLDLSPCVWMVCYGLGILSVAVVLDWEFRVTAWAFLVAGSASAFPLREHPNLCLGLAFGGLHLALGALRLAKERRVAWRTRAPSYDSRT